MVHARSALRACALVGVATFAGCGSSTSFWGVLHGDVSVDADGNVSGVFVWEFFDAGWERSQSADDHRCGRVVAVQGTPDSTDNADSTLSVALQTENIEHDCSSWEGSDPSLASMDRLVLRPAASTPAGNWPDDRWTWALGWSGGAVADEGVAWDEGMEFGEPPADRSSLLGRRVRLSPTDARGFSTAPSSSDAENGAADE